jgi:hypothetical protein
MGAAADSRNRAVSGSNGRIQAGRGTVIPYTPAIGM